MSKAKKLPVGARPVGLPIPPKSSNVLVLPTSRNWDKTGSYETKVIFVDFHTRQKIGHVS